MFIIKQREVSIGLQITASTTTLLKMLRSVLPWWSSG